jgi:hypothetical protein
VLPFVGTGEAHEVRRVHEDEAVKTLAGALVVPVKPALPFREVNPWEEAPPSSRASEHMQQRGSGEVLPFARTPQAVAPLVEVAPILVRADGWAPELGFEHAPPPVAAPPPPAPTPRETPAPPPMIGPLARPEMAEAPPELEEPALPAAPEAPAAPVLPAPPEDPGLPLDRYPLERCAAIAASIARSKPEKERILEEHELDPRTWEALDKHWKEAVTAQAGRGRTSLLKAYDKAYVEQLEKERGPIRLEEYARIVVAQERGSVDEELAAMTLPRGALLRIQGVWLGRVAADAELAKSVRAAVEEARER